jgi:hypothetical protein
MEKIQNVQVPCAEQQDWQIDIKRKLDERGVITVEGNGILTAKDVLSAISVIDNLETNRDETSEWDHIKKLQHERAERLSGGNDN